MPLKPARRRPNTKLALRIARAQLRAIRAFAPTMPVVQPKAGPPKFVMCWSVGRGYSGITQALDSDGQVWERVSVIEKVGGVSQLKASWWEKLDMTRGKPAP